MAVTQVSDENFNQEVLQSDKPTLVDFWAEWCGPCHAVSPAVERISESYAEQMKFTKLNVDESPSTSAVYGIRSIPTLMVFKDGKVFSSIIGAVPEAKLLELVKAVL